MIGYTLPEIRRLLISLVQHYLPDPKHTWAWSYWRRRRQYEARLCHYRRRGYAPPKCRCSIKAYVRQLVTEQGADPAA